MMARISRALAVHEYKKNQRAVHESGVKKLQPFINLFLETLRWLWFSAITETVSAQTMKCHLFMNLFQQTLAVFFSITETGSGTDYQAPRSEGFVPRIGQESQSNIVHELFVNCS